MPVILEYLYSPVNPSHINLLIFIWWFSRVDYRLIPSSVIEFSNSQMIDVVCKVAWGILAYKSGGGTKCMLVIWMWMCGKLNQIGKNIDLTDVIACIQYFEVKSGGSDK